MATFWPHCGPILTQDHSALFIDFGSALFYAGVAADYESIALDYFCMSLFEVFAAKKDTTAYVDVETSEADFVEYLRSWQVPTLDTTLGTQIGTRPPTMAERNAEKLTWG